MSMSSHDIAQTVMQKRVKEKEGQEKNEQYLEKKKTALKEPYKPMTVRSLRALAADEMRETSSAIKDREPGHVEPESILELTKDVHRLGEKSVSEYIFRNKAMLLSERALEIKEQDIFRMKDLASNLEDAIEKDEERLEKDAMKFNAFIEHTNAVTAAVIEKAAKETKLRVEKTEEVKEINAKIFSLKSNIDQLDKIMSQYLRCDKFLKASSSAKESCSESNDEKGSDDSSTERNSEQNMSNLMLEGVEFTGNMEPVDIPFKDAQELLKAINLFRDQNLSIMTNSHYLRNDLKKVGGTFAAVQDKMNQELKTHTEQILKVEKEIDVNCEKVEKLRLRTEEFSARSSAEENNFQDTVAPSVALTYELCTGVKGENISPAMMVTNIESNLLELLSDMKKIPEKILMRAYKLTRMERNAKKKRDEEIRKSKALEERLKTADLRRYDSGKTKLTRRLKYQPQQTKQIKKKEETSKETMEYIQKDDSYFLT